MEGMMATVLWIAAGALLVLYMMRRRKRKINLQ
jgi:hypothetical protein